MKYLVEVAGCDDGTFVSIELTSEEAAAIRKVSELVNAHAWGCKPSLDLYSNDSPVYNQYIEHVDNKQGDA